MLRLVNVCKDWKNFELKNVSFEVDKYEYFVILGHSGAGKTLLLKVIAGIYRPDRGRIYLDGREITHEPPEKRDLAYVPQNYALFPHLSVYDNIAYGLKIRGLEKSEIRRTVLELAEILGIEHVLHRKPRTLSGGEQQRVALARALAVKPKVLLLDEPLSNVDVQTRSRLIREMKRWRRELEFTAIHVTHNLEEAAVLGDRIGVMIDGRLEQVGSVRDVFSRPKTAGVARFFGYNVIRGNAKEGLIDLGFAKLKTDARCDGSVEVVFKPEDVVISRKGGEFRARVEAIEIFRLMARISLNAEGSTINALVPVYRIFEEDVEEGDTVYVSIRDFRIVDSGR